MKVSEKYLKDLLREVVCNKIPLGLCFMHPPKNKKRSRKHKKNE
jgi:hypothetical protein